MPLLGREHGWAARPDCIPRKWWPRHSCSPASSWPAPCRRAENQRGAAGRQPCRLKARRGPPTAIQTGGPGATKPVVDRGPKGRGRTRPPVGDIAGDKINRASEQVALPARGGSKVCGLATLVEAARRRRGGCLRGPGTRSEQCRGPAPLSDVVPLNGPTFGRPGRRAGPHARPRAQAPCETPAPTAT